MPRISKDPQERKDEILDAAMELFNNKGYEQTSVSDIVKKIGVAQGTFYYYFQSKEEVVHAACERTMAFRMDQVKQLVDSKELHASEKLLRLFTEDYPNERNDAVFEYVHQENNSTLHQKWIVAEIEALLPYVRQIVQQGMEEGTFRVSQPDVVAEFLLVGASFWLDEGIFAGKKEEYAEKKQALAVIIDRLLGGSHGTSTDTILNE
ncbi:MULTISPECIES: TetR/AcrR family transcriptional regulator [Paenibacillus]|uniref:TetR family transcriptional regulator n=1 Tax=Paenibacillus albilobatus TaxID=2716884 RepID=A0A919XIF8_9BACL|nr:MULTISPECIES: TetR/AcrR family transcriptional regulator [Paenibacillus]GIO31327.1 TetR family transcriptional regulator [Paenibacillus albilobatus]